MDMKRRLLRVDHLPMMALQLTESNSLEIRTPHVEFHPHAVDVVETGSAFKLQEVAASPHLVKEDAARKKHIGKVELEACLVGTEFQGRFPDQGALLGDVYDDVPDESDEGVYDALEKAYNAAFSNSTMDRVERDRKFHQKVGQVTLAHRAPHHHLPKRQSTSESFGAWKERLLEGRKDAIFAVLKSKALDDLNDYREYFIQQHQRKLNAMRNRKLELDASDVWRDDIVGTSAVETAATHLDERLGRRKAALRDLAARCRDLQLKRQTRPQSNDSLGDNATMTKGDEISSSPLPATTSNGHNPIMIARPRDILADNAKLVQYLIEEANVFVDLLLGSSPRPSIANHGPHQEANNIAETNASRLYRDHVDDLAEFDADCKLRCHLRCHVADIPTLPNESQRAPILIDVSNPFQGSSTWDWVQTGQKRASRKDEWNTNIDTRCDDLHDHRRMAALSHQGVNGLLLMGTPTTYDQMVALLVGGVASGPPSLVVTPHVLEWEAAFASSSSVRVVSYWGRPDDRKLMRTMWRPPRVHVVLTHPQTLEQDAAGDLESVLWQVVTCDHAPPRRPVDDKEDGYPSPPWSGRALGLRCRQRWLMLSTEAKVDLRLLLHFVAPALFDSKQKTMAWGTAALDDVAVHSLRSIVQRVCVGPSEALDEATRHTLDVTADERAVLMALDSTPSIEYVLATPSKEDPSEMDYLEKYKRRNSHAKIVVDTKRLMLRTPTTPMLFETPSSSIELSLPKPTVVDPKLIACKHCAKTFMTSSGLLKHTKSDHAPPGTWTCRKCGVDCGTMALRNAHERQEHDESITPANKPTEQLLVAATTWTTPAPHTPGSAGSSASTKPSRRSTGGGGGKKRVTRCGKCAGCVSGDCMECGHCQDMKKYGGPGLRKQSCKNRKCTNPQVLGSVGGDDDSSKVRVEFDESESSGESSSESADPRRDSIDHSIDDGDVDDDDDDDAPIKSPHAAKSKASRGAASRTRVMRCGVCVGCVAGDCLKCRHCQDMKKYGGPGLRKQSCKSRKCVTPKVVLLNQGQEDDDDDDDLLYDEPHHQHTPRSSTSTTTSSAVPHPPPTTTPLWEKETLVDAASALAPSVRLQAQLNRFLKITCLRCNAKFLNQSLKSVHDAVVHKRHATSLWQRMFVRDRLATLQFQHTLVATDPRRKKSLEFEPVGYAKLVGPGLTYYMLRPQATLGRVGSEWKDRYRTMGVDLRRGFSGGDVDCHLGDDLMISAQHAKIRWDVRRQRFVIECLSVLAPLSVNGLEVTFDMAPLPLASQSLVQVGAFYFFFLLPVASSNNHPPSIAADIAQTSRHRQGLPRQEVYAWLAHKRAALRLSRLQQDQESHIKRKGDSVDDTALKRRKVNPHAGAACTTDMGSGELDRRTAA